MKKILVLFLIVLLTGCSHSGPSSSRYLEPSSIEESVESSVKKDFVPDKNTIEYYESIDHIYSMHIFTWINNGNERMFGMIPSNGISFMISYKKILFLQNEVFLNLEWISHYNKKGVLNRIFYIINIPYPFTEDFYYNHYLLEYPSPEYFVQDYRMYEEIGNSSGYQELIEKGLITR